VSSFTLFSDLTVPRSWCYGLGFVLYLLPCLKAFRFTLLLFYFVQLCWLIISIKCTWFFDCLALVFNILCRAGSHSPLPRLSFATSPSARWKLPHLFTYIITVNTRAVLIAVVFCCWLYNILSWLIVHYTCMCYVVLWSFVCYIITYCDVTSYTLLWVPLLILAFCNTFRYQFQSTSSNPSTSIGGTTSYVGMTSAADTHKVVRVSFSTVAAIIILLIAVIIVKCQYCEHLYTKPHHHKK